MPARLTPSVALYQLNNNKQAREEITRMFNLVFVGPPDSGKDNDLLLACDNQLRPLIEDIVQAAVAAGWEREDVLLRLVELSWSMHEMRSGTRPV